MKLVHDNVTRRNAMQTLEAHLRDLVELLQTEYNAIRERDSGGIAMLSDAKQELVDSINALVTTTDANDLLTAVAADGASDIIALLEQCRHANRVNGAAIETSQTFAAAMLDILRGRSPGQRIYTARGRFGMSSETSTLVVV
jgi:flagellar biosynthesis/type III secretory pathway chaperone